MTEVLLYQPATDKMFSMVIKDFIYVDGQPCGDSQAYPLLEDGERIWTNERIGRDGEVYFIGVV